MTFLEGGMKVQGTDWISEGSQSGGAYLVKDLGNMVFFQQDTLSINDHHQHKKKNLNLN